MYTVKSLVGDWKVLGKVGFNYNKNTLLFILVCFTNIRLGY